MLCLKVIFEKHPLAAQKQFLNLYSTHYLHCGHMFHRHVFGKVVGLESCRNCFDKLNSTFPSDVPSVTFTLHRWSDNVFWKQDYRVVKTGFKFEVSYFWNLLGVIELPEKFCPPEKISCEHQILANRGIN